MPEIAQALLSFSSLHHFIASPTAVIVAAGFSLRAKSRRLKFAALS
jgi:hypothetical protein